MVADVALFVFLAIKDADVAGAVQAAERDDSLSPSESRSRIFRAIQEKYTAPE